MSPSKYTIRLLRVAEEDLAEIVNYIAAERLSAAEALIDRIEKSLQSLQEHPYLGRIPDDVELLKLGYRYLIVDDYLIFYVVDKRAVIVHRIIHGARYVKDLYIHPDKS
jgi:toxin ParE1/3/4